MPSSGSISSPVPRDDEAVLAVGDDEQRLEPAQHAVAAPVLGQLDRGARQVAGIALELLLELLEQRERVGRGAGEAGERACRREACAPSGHCDFMTVSPTVTWPSPPSATCPSRRTARMVVDLTRSSWLFIVSN